MPFPAKGQGAVAISGTGVVAASPDEQPVPIASMTKMMTAYLVLQTHPLVGNEGGPVFTLTAADHAAWVYDAQNDLSNVELLAGEKLDERQLLEALLIPSADNVANIFASWVSGTEARFVALMNATARKLGMDQTTYADASGVSSHTVSTAANQALLATILMKNPVVRSIVRQPDVPFPVEGRVWNYNPELGVDGIVGVKSGFTGAAGSCLTTAAWRTVGGRSVLVVSVVTGQPLGLQQAGQADIALLNAETQQAKELTPFGDRTVVATVHVPWSHRSIPASISAPFDPIGPQGLDLSFDLVGAPVTATELREGWGAGTVVGTLEVTSPFGTVAQLPVSLDRAIPPPPSGSRLPRLPTSFPVHASSGT